MKEWLKPLAHTMQNSNEITSTEHLIGYIIAIIYLIHIVNKNLDGTEEIYGLVDYVQSYSVYSRQAAKRKCI